MNSFTKKQIMRLLIALIPSTENRTKCLKRYNVFKFMGENNYFQPRIIPADPKQIKLHNNVVVASNVTFIAHDVMDKMIRNMGYTNCVEYNGCIEILDNVFIGANTTILPNIRIGPNVIIAANSVVTKDIAYGVVAGVPAKKIGAFDDLVKARIEMSKSIFPARKLSNEQLWEQFNSFHKQGSST